MGQGDRTQRTVAVPFYSLPFGFSHVLQSDGDIGSFATGDLLSFRSGGTLAATNAIRMTHPYYGGLISCNLNLKFTLAAAEAARQLQIAIGTFNADLTAVTSYSATYIAASHKLITGRDTPYTISAAGTFNNAKIDLKSALYARTDSNYKDDGFVILLAFDVAPGTGTGWDLNRFEVHATADVGVQI